jgi:hypothetical protein
MEPGHRVIGSPGQKNRPGSMSDSGRSEGTKAFAGTFCTLHRSAGICGRVLQTWRGTEPGKVNATCRNVPAAEAANDATMPLNARYMNLDSS